MENNKIAARRIGKRVLSVILAIAVLLPGVCFFSLPEAEAALTVTPAAKATLVVPDTIYLKPSSGNATVFEYYLNNDTNGTANPGAAETSGKIYFSLTGATNITATLSGTNVSVTVNNGSETSFTGKMTNGGVASAKSQVLTWTFSFTLNGKACTTQAYTVVYAPFTQITGAAGRANNNGSGSNKAYIASVLWWQGIHSVAARPNTTSSNKGLSDDANYIPNAALQPMITGVTDTGGTTNITSWLTQTNTNPTIRYGKNDTNGGDWTNAFVTGYTASLTVDSSRFTNTNQIPNLKCGLFLSDAEGVNTTKSYYLSIYKTVASDDYIHGAAHSDDENHKKANPTNGSYIYSDKSTNTDKKIAGSDDYSAGLLYNNTVSYGISQNVSTTYSFGLHSNIQGHHSGANYAYAAVSLYAPMNITAVNKSTLRSHVASAYGLIKENYTEDSWNAYQAVVKLAAENLGKPDSALTSDSISAKLLVTKTGTVTAVHKSTTGKELDTETKSYNFCDGITASANDYNGYTFKEQSVAADSETITADVNMFDLDAFYNVPLSRTGPNAASVSVNNGTLTFTSGGGTDNYTNMPDWGPNPQPNFNLYFIPVTPGKTYTLSYTAAGTTAQAYVFGMKADGVAGSNYNCGGNYNTGNATITFTAEDTTHYVCFRFGNSTPNSTTTFSNIVFKPSSPVTYTIDNPVYTFTYTPNNYTATFVKKVFAQDEATQLSTSNYNIESSFSFPTDVTEDFCTFDGVWKVTTPGGSWTVNDATTYSGTSEVGKYGNVTFTAQFTPINYRIQFNPDGGSNITADNMMDYNITTVGSLPVPVKTGYTFTGWKPEATVGNWNAEKEYTTVQKMHGSTANDIVTLKAQWATNTSHITLTGLNADDITPGYDLNADGKAVLEYNFSSAKELTSPSRNGYAFKGWKVTASPVYVDTDPVENRWKAAGEVYALGTGETKVTLPGNMLYDVALEPVWEAKEYTLKYALNNGTSTDCGDKTYKITDTFNLGTATRNGYDFGGWVSGSTGNDNNWGTGSYNGGASVSGKYGTIELAAQWQPHTYKITLNANGGSCSVSEYDYNIEAGIGVNTLAQPVRDGYTFTGWKVTAAEGTWETGAVYTRDTGIPTGKYGNVTLTAQWSAATYTISLIYGTTSLGTMSYNITSSAFTLDEIPRDGYTFEYWSVQSTAGNWSINEQYYKDTPITGKWGNVTLAANYTPVISEITYKNEKGEQLGEKVSYSIDAPVELRTGYSVNGYTFNGWKAESTDGNWTVGSVYTGTTATRYGNAVLVPDLTPTTYKASFASEGPVTVDGVGKTNPECEYDIECDFTLPDTSKDNYDFAGWKVTTPGGSWELNETYAAGTPVLGKYGNVTFTATWTPKKYTVTYVLDSENSLTKLVAYGETAPDLEASQKVRASDAQFDYTFSRWDKALGTVTGDTTYTAVFTETLRSYTITWILPETDNGDNTYSGQKQEHETFKYGDTPSYKNGAIPTLATPDTSEYQWSFLGWSSTDKGEIITVPAVTGNAVYYAVFEWIETPAEITWVVNGVESADICKIGNIPEWKGVTPTKPDANGYKYTFSGWTPALETAERGKSYTYTAVFEESCQTYSYRLYPNGGEVTGATAGNYTMETGIDFPEPAIPGYAFTGWKLDSVSGSWTADKTPSAGHYDTNGLWGNVTFTAQWEPAEFTVTYTAVPDGVTVPGAKTFTINDKFILGNAEREGYTHIGWVIDDASGNWSAGQIISPETELVSCYGDVSVSPLWKVNSYTVYWVSGDITNETYVDYGAAIVAQSPVNKAGYTAAWSEEIPETMPAGALTFNAAYTPVSYSVRIDLNGGEGAESFSYTIEDASRLLPSPTRTGAAFAGWRVAVADGNWVRDAVAAAGTPVKGKYGHITLIAQWEMDICTVTWKAGDVTKVARWHYGDTPSFDGTPYKSTDETNSYIFSGWDKEILPLTGDITYIALFTPTVRTYTVRWRVGAVETVETYNAGELPDYGGTPERASTDEYTYSFSGWSPEVTAVTGDAIYTAQFDIFTKIRGISIDTSYTSLEISEKRLVKATIMPSTASVKDISWESLNTDVATVSATGEITAVSSGFAVIKASDKEGKFSSYCVVSVDPIVMEYVSISAKGISTTQQAGSTLQLYATKMPENATNTDIVWSSSNPSVASVSQSGFVTFVKTGKATITAKSTDGFASGSIDVETAAAGTEIQEQVKTYVVSFAGAATNFIIHYSGEDGTWDSIPYQTVSVLYKAGDEVIFKLENSYLTPLVNGVSYKAPEADGYYHIRNLDRNLSIIDEIVPIGIDDINPDDGKNDAPSFWQRVQEFFRKIVLFFRNLFS